MHHDEACGTGSEMSEPDNAVRVLRGANMVIGAAASSAKGGWNTFVL
jgi:hypothetical protein